MANLSEELTRFDRWRGDAISKKRVNPLVRKVRKSNECSKELATLEWDLKEINIEINRL